MDPVSPKSYGSTTSLQSPRSFKEPPARKSRYTGDARRTTMRNVSSTSYTSSLRYAEFVRNMKAILLSPKFDAAVGVVIVLNSISIGLEMSYELEGKDTALLEMVEHVFLLVYMGELGMRFFCYGVYCLRNPWVAFDFVLVVTGVITSWIIVPIVGSLPAGVGPLMILRVMRLFRLARAIRLLVQFKVLWMLVSGLLGSVGTIMYTFCLVSLITYVWACVGIELITKHQLAKGPDDDPFVAAVNTHFSSVPQTMLTFNRLLFVDSACDIYTPIVKGDKRLLLYFMLYTAVVSVALLNLVTAVIVEGALEQAEQDKEMQLAHEEQKKKLVLQELKELFETLDVDQSGCLSYEEMSNAPQECQDKMVTLFKDATNYDDVLEMAMDMLDMDRDGEVSYTEFTEGISKMIFGKAPQELLSIHKHVSQMHGAFKSAKTMSFANLDDISDGDTNGQDNEDGGDDSMPAHEVAPKSQGKSVPPEAKELHELWLKVDSLLAQVRRSIKMEAEKAKQSSMHIDPMKQRFESNEDAPSGPLRATVWKGKSPRGKSQGGIIGDDDEPPADEKVEEHLSFQELLAENVWLRNQLMDRALEIDDKKELLLRKEAELENVMKTLLQQLPQIVDPDTVDDDLGAGNVSTLDTGFGAGRTAAKKPMKSVRGDMGDIESERNVDHRPSVSDAPSQSMQLAVYNGGKHKEDETMSKILLPRERLLELVGFTLRTSPGAKEAWQSGGGGEINPNACSEVLLQSFLQDVNPDLLRFALGTPTTSSKKK
eukprot:gnl/MRDRNA2_/MRDRNA2_75631_c0_seq1.p1 gnl/MRDRNA2_/MRDRNA2_75631_c0~~gnl/MRDRNA2_/MRDRNA2_75631_c0_seq1.p1  ORF type:complete len:768 (+),score=161.93 gnl/MRDRNA2_/MRDRNA2_75631_c0_seq1:86-2389(+)